MAEHRVRLSLKTNQCRGICYSSGIIPVSNMEKNLLLESIWNLARSNLYPIICCLFHVRKGVFIVLVAILYVLVCGNKFLHLMHILDTVRVSIEFFYCIYNYSYAALPADKKPLTNY